MGREFEEACREDWSKLLAVSEIVSWISLWGCFFGGGGCLFGFFFIVGNS